MGSLLSGSQLVSFTNPLAFGSEAGNLSRSKHDEHDEVSAHSPSSLCPLHASSSLWWNVEDWADDLHYNLTHMDAGGPLGFGILGTTPPPQPGLLAGLLGLIFPTTTTTTAPTTTTKCSGVIGLGLAC